MSNAPIFIVGCRRSGTTLMLNILNHHPEIGLFPGETHFLDRRVRKVNKFNKENQESITNILKKSVWEADVEGGKDIFLHNLIEKVFVTHDGEMTPDIFLKLFLTYAAEAQQKKIWGEKTPTHMYHVKTIKKWFPEAKIIQLIRDPRAVTASHIYRMAKKSVLKINPKVVYLHYTFPRIILHWLESARLAEEYQNKYGENYKIVKFEDMVLQPKETLEDICLFIGIEFDNSMLDVPVYHSLSIKRNLEVLICQQLTVGKGSLRTGQLNLLNWFVGNICRNTVILI